MFAHAEATDAVLLLDEGDALLGRRTSVQAPNDRYANLGPTTSSSGWSPSRASCW